MIAAGGFSSTLPEVTTADTIIIEIKTGSTVFFID